MYGEVSTPQRLSFGVPQGSVLGPKLYSAYVKPLGEAVKQSGVPNHMFADDTQMHKSFNPSSPGAKEAAIAKLEEVTNKTRSWMTSNKLKLNSDKTEVLLLTSKHKPSIEPVSLKIGDATVMSQKKVRDLGVTLDGHMTMEAHVNSVVKSCMAQLKKIGHIRRYLTPEAAKTLVHAQVTSRMDYCNCMLYGLPKVLLNKLQRVQNMSARIVSRTSRYEHITPVLKELHWLPVEKRIHFKILVHTYRSIHGEAPVYLQNLVKEYRPTRQLRSSSETKLVLPRTKTVSYGERSFQYAAAHLWNDLPSHVRNVPNLTQFRKVLKTHYFSLVY